MQTPDKPSGVFFWFAKPVLVRGKAIFLQGMVLNFSAAAQKVLQLLPESGELMAI